MPPLTCRSRLSTATVPSGSAWSLPGTRSSRRPRPRRQRLAGRRDATGLTRSSSTGEHPSLAVGDYSRARDDCRRAGRTRTEPAHRRIGRAPGFRRPLHNKSRCSRCAKQAGQQVGSRLGGEGVRPSRRTRERPGGLAGARADPPAGRAASAEEDWRRKVLVGRDVTAPRRQGRVPGPSLADCRRAGVAQLGWRAPSWPAPGAIGPGPAWPKAASDPAGLSGDRGRTGHTGAAPDRPARFDSAGRAMVDIASGLRWAYRPAPASRGRPADAERGRLHRLGEQPALVGVHSRGREQVDCSAVSTPWPAVAGHRGGHLDDGPGHAEVRRVGLDVADGTCGHLDDLGGQLL